MRSAGRLRTRFGVASALAMLLGLTSLEPATAYPSWQGRYFWQGQDGNDGGATAATDNQIVLQVTLILSDEACTITEQGFQTDLTIVCLARPIPNGIALSFVSYGDGGPANQYGAAGYKPGERLFSLAHDGAGRLVTRWGRLKPDFLRNPTGEYFALAP